jgi:hypothetical protein
LAVPGGRLAVAGLRSVPRRRLLSVAGGRLPGTLLLAVSRLLPVVGGLLFGSRLLAVSRLLPVTRLLAVPGLLPVPGGRLPVPRRGLLPVARGWLLSGLFRRRRGAVARLLAVVRRGLLPWLFLPPRVGR